MTPSQSIGTRTSYFREEYAYGENLLLDGVEVMRSHEGLIDAARSIHGRPVIEPAIVYANLFLPGQELAVHTDVPGVPRPEPQARAAVAARRHAPLRALRRVAAPDRDGHRLVRPRPRAETLVVLARRTGRRRRRTSRPGTTPPPCSTPTACSTASSQSARRARTPPILELGSVLGAAPDGRVVLRDDAGRAVRSYEWDELRFSVSWKAYCFTDEDERATWREHRDDLDLTTVLDALVADLTRRGRVGRVHQRAATSARS